MSAGNPLFILPKSLTGKRPALDVRGHIQDYYQRNKLPEAKVAETLQEYIDALNSDIASIIGVLQQTNVTPIPVDTDGIISFTNY